MWLLFLFLFLKTFLRICSFCNTLLTLLPLPFLTTCATIPTTNRVMARMSLALVLRMVPRWATHELSIRWHWTRRGWPRWRTNRPRRTHSLSRSSTSRDCGCWCPPHCPPPTAHCPLACARGRLAVCCDLSRAQVSVASSTCIYCRETELDLELASTYFRFRFRSASASAFASPSPSLPLPSNCYCSVRASKLVDRRLDWSQVSCSYILGMGGWWTIIKIIIFRKTTT